jgi:hypothetical protein
MNRGNAPQQPTYPVLSGDVWDGTTGFDEQTTSVVERPAKADPVNPHPLDRGQRKFQIEPQ